MDIFTEQLLQIDIFTEQLLQMNILLSSSWTGEGRGHEQREVVSIQEIYLP